LRLVGVQRELHLSEALVLVGAAQRQRSGGLGGEVLAYVGEVLAVAAVASVGGVGDAAFELGDRVHVGVVVRVDVQLGLPEGFGGLGRVLVLGLHELLDGGLELRRELWELGRLLADERQGGHLD